MQRVRNPREPRETMCQARHTPQRSREYPRAPGQVPVNARAQRKCRENARAAELPLDVRCAAEESRECDLMPDEREESERETTTTFTALSGLTPSRSQKGTYGRDTGGSVKGGQGKN